MQSLSIPSFLPVLPTFNNKVLLPGIVVRFEVQRPDSISMLDSLRINLSEPSKPTPLLAVMPCVFNVGDGKSKQSFIMRTYPLAFDESLGVALTAPIEQSDLNVYGTVGRIVQISKDGDIYRITVEGVSRFKLITTKVKGGHVYANVLLLKEAEVDESDLDTRALVHSFKLASRELFDVLKKLQLPAVILRQFEKTLTSAKPGILADLIGSMIDLSYSEKLEILAADELAPRITRLMELINRQLQIFQLSKKLSVSVENKMGAKQREMLLREQLEAIRKELGESDDGGSEISDLEKKVRELDLPAEASKIANREMSRLKRANPNQAEHQLIRTYLELIVDLPWSISSADQLDIKHATKVLDDDHFGLDKVKKRVLEYLAIRKLKNDMKGPILCLLGPPGVGKTSLGKSIATALGRKFYRISLGGIKDEAEIRGHRRTYVGAMPGLIIQAMKRCGTNNPVILLDEIDKMGRDQRGDPSSALLEVLDPEQNIAFNDHYLNIEFDLSKVLFIATANEYETIPSPLMDRMELIRLDGYTIDEKLKIGERFLLPKQISAHGLQEGIVNIPLNILEQIVVGYTREAGVRGLERQIGAVCRNLAVQYSSNEPFDGIVTLSRVEDILGIQMYENDMAEKAAVPGAVTGLAYTSFGGGLLTIETSKSPGKGNLILTGKLGDVIKESARIALSWVRSNLTRLNLSLEASFFDKNDIHIHFPAGATPKDGPSAGLAISIALVSMLLDVPISNYIAMTGEMTLRGQVMPVGGIKEKLLAAGRGGIKTVFLPERNRRDLTELPEALKRDMKIIPVKTIWDVLEATNLVVKSVEARL